jgi:REP element-mobilizing transposase RayT
MAILPTRRALPVDSLGIFGAGFWHRWCDDSCAMDGFYNRCVRGWRPEGPGPVYFVTWRLAQRQPGLAPAERQLVSQVLHHGDGDRFRLLAFVVMDDHVHVLVQPRTVPLDRLVHSWKSLTSHQFQQLHRRAAPVWQNGSLDRVVGTPEELRQKAEYIVGNPWKRWPFIKGYAWVWEVEDTAGVGR